MSDDAPTGRELTDPPGGEPTLAEILREVREVKSLARTASDTANVVLTELLAFKTETAARLDALSAEPREAIADSRQDARTELSNEIKLLRARLVTVERRLGIAGGEHSGERP